MSYLLIPRIQVRGANALACPYVINAAPVMAINLFVHNLSRLGFCRASAVAILHHDGQILAETGPEFYNALPHQRRGAAFIDKADYSSKNKHALSMQPTASVHLTLSLILHCEGAVDIDALSAYLPRGRLAGGQITHHGTCRVLSDADAVHDELRSGSWLIERRDWMQTAPDPIDALIGAVGFQHPRPEDESTLPDSWLTPTVLGYATVTPFARRAGVRMTDDGQVPPHAFAEPLLGLVQYVSVRDYGRERPLPLWRQDWIADDVFVVRQQEQPA